MLQHRLRRQPEKNSYFRRENRFIKEKKDLKSSSRALLAIGVFAVLALGLLFWSVQQNRAKAAEMEKQILSKLDAKDINLLLQSQAKGNPQQLAALNDNPEARKEVLEQLRGLLAQAAAARRAGVAEDPIVKAQMDLQEKILVASLYDTEQNKGKPAPPFGNVTPQEIEAYWKNTVHETEFNKAIDVQTGVMKAAGQTAPKLEGKRLEDTRKSFAGLMVTYEKAKADANFMNKRELQLQIGLQQALLLAREYSTKNLVKEVEPTKEEIAAYLVQHPEYDAVKQREKAEGILQRAKAGEDFAALANQYSEDPGNKDPQTGQPKGGLYEDISQGSFVPEFEAAALAVDKGQVVPNLVETQYGYHIIKLEDKKVGKGTDGKEGVVFSARHILLQNKFPAPNSSPMGRPQLLSGEDLARTAVGEEKQKKAIDELVARNKIELPEDFTVDVPEGADGNIPLPQQNLPQGMPAPAAPPSGKTPVPTGGKTVIAPTAPPKQTVKKP